MLESVDAGLDEAVDLLGRTVVERREQSELAQHFRKIATCRFDCLRLQPGLVDHAAVPLGDGGADVEAAHRAEGEGRVAVGTQLIRVVKAAGLPAAEAAGSQPMSSIESFRDAESYGVCAIWCDASTMKRLIAFSAMASRSGMVKERIG